MRIADYCKAVGWLEQQKAALVLVSRETRRLRERWAGSFSDGRQADRQAETDRQTGMQRQTNRQKQTGRQTAETGKQTGRDRQTETDRQRQTGTDKTGTDRQEGRDRQADRQRQAGSDRQADTGSDRQAETDREVDRQRQTGVESCMRRKRHTPYLYFDLYFLSSLFFCQEGSHRHPTPKLGYNAADAFLCVQEIILLLA